jgi:transposase-like protein
MVKLDGQLNKFAERLLEKEFAYGILDARYARVREEVVFGKPGVEARTLVVRVVPNKASCLRLVRTMVAEIHEGWLEANRYLNMEPRRERFHQPKAMEPTAA